MKFGIQLHCPVSKSYDAIGDEYIYIYIYSHLLYADSMESQLFWMKN